MASLCSLEELIEEGVAQHTSQLHSQTYSLSGWVLDSHFAVDTRPWPDVSYDSGPDDLFFDEHDSGSGADDSGPPHVPAAGNEIRIGRVLIWFDFFVTSDADRKEVEQSALRMSKDEWLVVCGNTRVRLIPVLQSRKRNETRQYSRTFSRSFSQQPVDSPELEDFKASSVAMAISPLLLCPFLVFERGEFTVEDPETPDEFEDSIKLTLMNVTGTVPRNQVETDDQGNLKICAILFEEKFEELLRADLREDPPGVSFWVLLENYLSLACVSMSLLCLLLTLVTYAAFKSLRTVPGQNTIGLCINLLLAQALLQFGVGWTELGVGCVALGMLIHYFWLSAVLWMNVCSFHMYRVFTARGASRAMASTRRVTCCTRRVVAYAVYAQGVPLVVIGATISSTILLSRGTEVGYGNGEACYLSTPLLVGAAFAAPLGLVLLLNLAFFLSAVKEITKTETPERAALRNGHAGSGSDPGPSRVAMFPAPWRRNLNVSIRLSSLTGLFWALGLLAELLDLRVLRVVSTVVNGSQGVVIAASYLLTRRVLRLYAQACRCGAGRARRKERNVSPTIPSAAASATNGVSVAVSTSTLNLSATNVNDSLQVSQM